MNGINNNSSNDLRI